MNCDKKEGFSGPPRENSQLVRRLGLVTLMEAVGIPVNLPPKHSLAAALNNWSFKNKLKHIFLRFRTKQTFSQSGSRTRRACLKGRNVTDTPTGIYRCDFAATSQSTNTEPFCKNIFFKKKLLWCVSLYTNFPVCKVRHVFDRRASRCCFG